MGGGCHLFFKHLGEYLLFLVVGVHFRPSKWTNTCRACRRGATGGVPRRRTARRTTEYRLMGAGGRRDGEVQATGRRIGEGWCRQRQSNDGRERGICVQIIGFARSLANRAGPFPLFSYPESPSAPRGTGVGLGSPDGFRPKSGGKTRNRGRDWAEYCRPDVKNGRRGPSRGDGWRCSNVRRARKPPPAYAATERICQARAGKAEEIAQTTYFYCLSCVKYLFFMSFI
jgi:hypothetical protein